MNKEDKEMPQTDEDPNVLSDQHEEEANEKEAWDRLIAAAGSFKSRYDIDTQEICREERRGKYE